MFKTLFLVALTAGLLRVELRAAAAQSVVVSEIMYHPQSTNLLEQWFELQNTGSLQVELSGWTISKGPAFTFPAPTVLAAGAYLVVVADQATFAGLHPGVANVVGWWTGDLGHSLALSDAAGQVVNDVEFYDQGDWAERVLGAGGQPGALDSYGGLGLMSSSEAPAPSCRANHSHPNPP